MRLDLGAGSGFVLALPGPLPVGLVPPSFYEGKGARWSRGEGIASMAHSAGCERACVCGGGAVCVCLYPYLGEDQKRIHCQGMLGALCPLPQHTEVIQRA